MFLRLPRKTADIRARSRSIRRNASLYRHTKSLVRQESSILRMPGAFPKDNKNKPLETPGGPPPTTRIPDLPRVARSTLPATKPHDVARAAQLQMHALKKDKKRVTALFAARMAILRGVAVAEAQAGARAERDAPLLAEFADPEATLAPAREFLAQATRADEEARQRKRQAAEQRLQEQQANAARKAYEAEMRAVLERARYEQQCAKRREAAQVKAQEEAAAAAKAREAAEAAARQRRWEEALHQSQLNAQRAEEEKRARLTREEEAQRARLLQALEEERARRRWEAEAQRMREREQQRFREEQAAQRLRELEQQRLLEEQQRFRSEAEAAQIAAQTNALVAYEKTWHALKTAKPSDLATLKIQFPWPVFLAASEADITLDNVRAFILSPLRPGMENKAPKERLRAEFLRWHPDKFEARFLGCVEEGRRPAVKKAAATIARLLVQINAQLDASS